MNLKVSFKNVFLYFSNRFSQKYSTKCVHLNFKTLLFKYPPTMRKNERTWKEINWMKLNRAHVECKAKQGWTKINALWWMNYILVHCHNDNPELKDSRCLLGRLLPSTSICFKTNVIIQLECLLDSVLPRSKSTGFALTGAELEPGTEDCESDCSKTPPRCFVNATG